MKIENIDIQATLEKAKSLMRDDKELSAAKKSMFELLIMVIRGNIIKWVLKPARCSTLTFQGS